MRFLALLLWLASLGWAQIVPGRYIVELTGDPIFSATGKAGPRRAASVDDRARIQAEQTTARQALEQRGAKVLVSIDVVANALVVEAGEHDAARLSATPGVKRVHPVRLYHGLLDRALPSHKVPEAWARVGGPEKAGEGARIAILDSGIDVTHPGFQDDTLELLEGYPQISSETNRPLTNRKIIVARSYEDLNDASVFGSDARDIKGHGTSAAMAAAGVPHESPMGKISGVAPRAYLGNYKVLGDNGAGTNAGILKAIEDAIVDGFEVLNLSLGSSFTGNPDEDLLVQALERAALSGRIVVVAAGNAGPDQNTITSPAIAANCIAVGSASNNRLFFFGTSIPIDDNRVSDFSSRGPNLGSGMKPDLAAVGDNFYTADSTLKDGSTGYTVTQGTSFAAPIVAGAAAVLRAARPGLTPEQYRSLLINSATPLVLPDGTTAPVRHAGAGKLNLDAALQSPTAAWPTSLKFGAGPSNPNTTRELTLHNLGQTSETYTLHVDPMEGAAMPVLSTTSLEIKPRQAGTVRVRFSGVRLPESEYQGFIRVRGSASGVETRVPYWYAVASDTPRSLTVLDVRPLAWAGTTATFGLRVLDGAGLAIDTYPLSISVSSGWGQVNELTLTPEFPGTYSVQVHLGPGENVFRIVAGGIARDVVIIGL